MAATTDPPPPATALMEELVEEVLLRFPPADPSRLVDAALVCRRWCALVAGPGFRRRFRELHRAPPLLGLLRNDVPGARFLPSSAFRPPGLTAGGLLRGWRALDARHGRHWECPQEVRGQVRVPKHYVPDEREPQMDILLSAVLGEVTTRSINLFMSKRPKPSALDVEDRLGMILLRARVIIEEAMGRQITNQAVLQQLDILSDTMYRGYYLLDTFRYQSHKEEAKDQIVSYPSLLSKVNSVKGYTRMYRQPYSMHILLGNCMFGRQMEAQHVINFLLRTPPPGGEGLEVLPIVERCAMKYQNSVSDKGGRVVIVIELAGHFNEGDWKRLYSASKLCLASGSKIIITGRSDEIKKLGTTQALTLKVLPYEAYWYYIRTLAFGSVDPETYPRLAHLTMEIARTNKRTFIGANITASVLRDNFDIHFWCKVAALLKGTIQKNVSRFGEHPIDRVDQSRPTPLGRLATPSEDLILYSQHECSSQEEVPKIKIQDVMYGSIKPHGKFEVLAWKSAIPPYHSFVFTCEIQELKGTAAKRKRSVIDGVRYC
nr:unnamed protein product [Digitaria exilis]